MTGIKIITEPTVRVVGRQIVDADAMAAFLAEHEVRKWTTDTANPAEMLVEIAGRLCYMSFTNPRPGGNAHYIEHILEAAHGSVLEHAVFNLIITGVSRSFTHELVRHRVGFSYSQLSQRFVDESDIAFVVPPLLIPLANAYHEHTATPDQYRDPWPQGACRLFESWLADVGRSLDSYRRLVRVFESETSYFVLPEDKTNRRKAAREAARSVLPNCTETKIFVTANARALRHFIELRGAAGADAEMRRVAVAILAVMQIEAPVIFGDFTVSDEGFVSVTHHKV